MKKVFYILFSFLLVSTLFHSCQKDDDTTYDETLLYGEWLSGTEHWKYKSDGTGVFWDTNDDVTEADGRRYKWQLMKSELGLTLMSTDETWGVPQYYTVTELTAKTLKYRDDFNKSYSFTKLN